ncbi:MAG: hypothetical protein ACE5IC_04040 [Candidatus Brocadiales bacterium]
MDQPTISIFVAVFTIALIHAILPHHWIPFALVGKSQGWSLTRTLGVTAVSSLGHSTATTAMGVVVAFLGFQITRHAEGMDIITGGILVAMGLVYITMSKKQTHNHGPIDPALSDRAATVSLFTMVTLSPCVELLPMFLAASNFTWSLLALMGMVLAAANAIGMLILTALAYKGVKWLRLERLEHHERKVVGFVLLIIGIGLILYHYTHYK